MIDKTNLDAIRAAGRIQKTLINTLNANTTPDPATLDALVEANKMAGALIGQDQGDTPDADDMTGTHEPPV